MIFFFFFSYPTFSALSDVSDFGRQSSEATAGADYNLLPEAHVVLMQRPEILAL